VTIPVAKSHVIPLPFCVSVFVNTRVFQPSFISFASGDSSVNIACSGAGIPELSPTLLNADCRGVCSGLAGRECAAQ
jgi:hypothetical protein